MTIPEEITYYLGKYYKISYNVLNNVLTIKQPINVWDFLKIKYFIYKRQFIIRNIVVEVQDDNC